MADASRWVQPGDRVRVRGERWRVLHVTPHEACALVELAGTEPGNRGRIARFLFPFEPFDRLPRGPERPRVVRRSVWRRAARASLADAVPSWNALRAPVRARMTLLPYQLEPALAMTRGLATRFLLADEVGLGKTIQAGLLAAEVLARRRGVRVLIVTPAGLREQWREELAERFGISAAVMDAAALARSAAHLGPDVNPWAIPAVAITSIDFLKRAEIIRSLEPLVWDLVAFDEAHALAGRTDRAVAADLVARRGRCVVAITATPHTGDDRAFERLCALGRLGPHDRLLMFRRARRDAGLPSARSVRLLAVQLTAEEQRVHRALDAYARRVAREASQDAAAAARLATLVLRRRACSSAGALARSIERRMALLASPPADGFAQMPLPLDDQSLEGDEEPTAELAAPGLRDAEAERRVLADILALAGAIRRESKFAALARFLRRAGEPAIVFTEYRDTLKELEAGLAAAGERTGPPALLHGGLTAAERTREARRFTHGDAALLLATDAASEGLNLHRRCRLVLNLDIPWSPVRLEQRIGRVDRLGQPRRVHALALVGRGTSDAAVAHRLTARTMHARHAAPFSALGAAAGGETVDLRAEAEHEVQRVRISRQLARGGTAAGGRGARPVLTVIRRGSSRRLHLAVSLLLTDAAGSAIWETVAAVVMTLDSDIGPDAAGLRRGFEETIVDGAVPLAASFARLHDDLLRRFRIETAPAVAAAVAREQAMLDAVVSRTGRLAARLVQAGLFDRRSLRDADAQHRLALEAADRSRARLSELRTLAQPTSADRHLLFAVVR